MLSRYLNLCLQFLTMNKKDFIRMTSTNNLIIVCCNTNTHCPISHEIKATRQWNLTSFFFFFLKSLYDGKANDLQLSFNICRYSSTWHTIKNKLHGNFRLIQRYPQIWFSEKVPRRVSSPHFPYNFSTKMFLKLYSVNWPNFVVWLSLHLQILGNSYVYCNMCLFPGCDVRNLEINLFFLIKPFFFMTKLSWQKFKYL